MTAHTRFLEADFNQLLKVLRREVPDRPVLFEFIINQGTQRQILGADYLPDDTRENRIRNWINGFGKAGYDFATFPIWEADLPNFSGVDHDRLASIGMAECGVIRDRATYESYAWPDPDSGDYAAMARATEWLAEGQQFIAFGPGGLQENLIKLIGYEPLCYMMADDPGLLHEISDRIGRILLRFYEHCLQIPSVGACFVNDDWGFKTGTFFDLKQMREYVFPWVRRIIETIHLAGRPAILHSCGNLDCLWPDIIEDLKIDGKHSWEDTILPIEQAYERFHSRIALVGGIDLDFLCRATPKEVEARAQAMLERTATRGGFALGSGNSIPDYVPFANYCAMCRPVWKARGLNPV